MKLWKHTRLPSTAISTCSRVHENEVAWLGKGRSLKPERVPGLCQPHGITVVRSPGRLPISPSVPTPPFLKINLSN